MKLSTNPVKPPNPSYLAKTPLTKISAMWKIQSPCVGSTAEATEQGEQKSNSYDECQPNK